MGDTLYQCDIDRILWRFLTHEEADKFLDGFHSRERGVHFSVILPRKRSYALVTFNWQFFEIVFLLSKSVMHAKFMIIRLQLYLLHYISLFPSDLLLNGVSASRPVTLTLSGGMVISLSQYIIFLNGPKRFLYTSDATIANVAHKIRIKV